jgi:hypothetical protein
MKQNISETDRVNIVNGASDNTANNMQVLVSLTGNLC